MAIMKGYDGEVKVGGKTIGYVNSATINVTRGTHEVSQLGNKYKEFEETVVEWSGNARATFDYADAAQKEVVDRLDGTTDDGALPVLSVKVSETKTYTGDVIMTNMQLGVEHANVVTADFSFQGSGTPNKVIL